MIDPRQTVVNDLRQGMAHLVQCPVAHALLVDVTDRDRIEHGGDAAGRHLGVVGQRRLTSRPFDLGSRLEILFHVVGVQLDQPWQQRVAFAIDGAPGLARAMVDGGDPAVADHQRAVDHLVVEHQPGVGQYLFLRAHDSVS